MNKKTYKWGTMWDCIYNWFTKREYQRITFFFLIGMAIGYEITYRVCRGKSGWGIPIATFLFVILAVIDYQKDIHKNE